MEALNPGEFDGFDWDHGNNDKNWDRHKVSRAEFEECFFNLPLLFFDDERHSSELEKRRIIFGRANNSRRLVTVFTLRNKKIRPISARDMSRKERKVYEENY